jgi:hypothetical protein
MEENLNYKDDVAQSRVGCLGSSDGKMLMQVCSLGFVPKSAHKRLAVCKGLIPQQEIPRTAAIVAGDEMEMAIYRHLSANDPRYESNPKWVSEKYSYKNVKLISHPDIVLIDNARKTVFVWEVKTTKYSVADTRQTYKAQLFIQYLLAKEIAERMGKDWTVKIALVHYNTDGLDLTEGVTFDPERLTIKDVRFTSTAFFDIHKAMSIVNDFLETFTEYYEGDEIDANLLPTNVKSQFDDVAAMLVEIKERESKVGEFKKRLYQFMVDKDIRTIKNDVFSITRVDESEAKSFDGKKYLEDMQKNHPRKAKKVLAQYTKVSKRSGYALIKVFTNKS